MDEEAGGAPSRGTGEEGIFKIASEAGGVESMAGENGAHGVVTMSHPEPMAADSGIVTAGVHRPTTVRT